MAKEISFKIHEGLEALAVPHGPIHNPFMPGPRFRSDLSGIREQDKLNSAESGSLRGPCSGWRLKNSTNWIRTTIFTPNFILSLENVLY